MTKASYRTPWASQQPRGEGDWEELLSFAAGKPLFCLAIGECRQCRALTFLGMMSVRVTISQSLVADTAVPEEQNLLIVRHLEERGKSFDG